MNTHHNDPSACIASTNVIRRLIARRANATVYSCGSSDTACWRAIQATLVDGSATPTAAGASL